MKKQWTLISATALILIVAFAVGGYFYKKNEQQKAQAKIDAQQELLIRSYSPTTGPADAPVTVVEFLDPECEACAAFHPYVKEILGQHPGKIRLVVRYMPLHKNSKYAAKILEIMRARGKFWETLELFFAKQPEWAQHHDPKPELLETYVKTLGLNKADLEAGLKDVGYATIVDQDQADARALGIPGTPSFFVNGQRVEKFGYQPLKEAVDNAVRSAG